MYVYIYKKVGSDLCVHVSLYTLCIASEATVKRCLNPVNSK